MHKIPECLVTQCIVCNQKLGTKSQRKFDHKLKIIKNISVELQLRIYKNKHILIKRNSHYSCNDCYEIMCNDNKYEIKSKQINEENIEYVTTAYHQIIESMENDTNKENTDKGVNIESLTDTQIKDMCGLTKSQISTLAMESGN